ncbi:MAG TPA: DUF4041 domain-containing protein [Pseudonocardiaceae bacterium]
MQGTDGQEPHPKSDMSDGSESLNDSGHVGVFGARKRLREIEAELRTAKDDNRGLRRALQDAHAQNADLVARLERFATDYARLRGADAVALDMEIRDTRARLAQLTGQYADEQAAIARRRSEIQAGLNAVRQEHEQAKLELLTARHMIVETQELALLQEAGIYEYKHPLADSVAYKSALAQLKDGIKSCARNNGAINATTNWTVNNSRVEGERMVRDFSKLMLRAYNAEADNCVRFMKPHRLDTSIDRLNKTRETICRLGRTMDINISDRYHVLRLQELALTADHLAKVEEEKERVRAERERQRDEKQARLEFEREKTRLAKEMSHWQNVRTRWLSAGDTAKLDQADAKLAEIDDAIRSVEAREANIRTGWVYVISNVGSFGENVVKIGLTRRLDPLERVRELGDASVPFKFDVHALIFDSDAVGLETTLHQRLAERRVNRVNLRREFFFATPTDVLQVLRELKLADNVVDYVDEPEALEWRTSRQLSDDGRVAEGVPSMVS